MCVRVCGGAHQLHNSPVVIMAVNVPAIAHEPPPLASQACRDRQLFEEDARASAVVAVRLVSVLFRKSTSDEWTQAAVLYPVTGRADERREWASQKHKHTNQLAFKNKCNTVNDGKD